MNKTVTLLLIEPTPRASRHTEWLQQRNYVVERISQWPWSSEELHGLRQYDLILMDEAFLKNPHQASLLATHHVAILANDNYSTAGFRNVSEKGAVGYIDGQQENSAKFVSEVEKILRKTGRLSRYGRLLIVDNDPDVLMALQNNLSLVGYQVAVAGNAEEAWEQLELTLPHIVIVDVRLKDNLDNLDESGFDLMEEIDNKYGHAVRIICLTGYSIPPKAAPKAVGRFAAFVYKEKGSNNNPELAQKIEEVLKTLHINDALTIELEGNLSLLELVNSIKPYCDYSEAKKKLVTLELEELIRKLFKHTLRVRAYHLSPGRGGSGVVLVRPILDNTPGEFFVLKFGQRENIRAELDRYNQFVKQFNRNWATYLVGINDKPVETYHLGCLIFSFSGMSREKPQNFNDFYRDLETQSADIQDALDNLFSTSCANWYRHKKPWLNDDDPDALALAFEDQLALDREKKQKELAETLSELLNGEEFQNICFERVDPRQICVIVNGESHLLPDPLWFVQTYRDSFPQPRFRCLTHGDLNGRNMFVDEERKVWLIDFFKTGWGPLLRDFGELETVIKFELLPENSLSTLFAFEQTLVRLNSLRDDIYPEPPCNDDNFRKACSTLGHLRQIAAKQYESTDLMEYEIGLLFYALKMITWDGVSSVDVARRPIRQRHAVLSAALLCDKLANHVQAAHIRP